MTDPVDNAVKSVDWVQVAINNGPPCFHLESEKFCLRAQRWDGHGVFHPFTPLDEMLAKHYTRLLK